MLTTILQTHRDDIAPAWAARTQTLPPGRYRACAPSDLLDFSSTAIGAIVRSLEAGSDELLKAHAREMAAHRAAQGFEIDEVIEGVLLLNEVALPFIFEACTRDGTAPIGPVLDLDASLRLMAAEFAAVFAESTRRTIEHVAALEERQRLGRDLHDSVSQSLYGLGMCAEAAARLLEAGRTAAAAARLRDVRDSASEALREMRFLIFELRPSILQDEGLVAALAARIAGVEQRVGVRATISGADVGRMPPAVEEALYGVAREALNNSLRHAHATRLEIRARREPGAVVLEVSDNGIGFDADVGRASGGLGLAGMRERVQRIGASVTVSSHPGSGTTVLVVAPLEAGGTASLRRETGVESR